MIELWQLPGPLRAARQIVSALDRGNQVSLRAEPDWERGLRLAVEHELARQHTPLTVMFEDPDATPAAVVAGSAGWRSDRPTGLFWVANVTTARAAAWQREIERIADTQRDRRLGERLQLVLPLPVTPDSKSDPGLTPMRDPIVLLTRPDLEVMTRYRLAQRPEPPAMLAIVAEVAIGLTLPMMRELGCDAVLDLLDRWLRMPLDCVGDDRRLGRFAAEECLPAADAVTLQLLLWRAQQAVLMAEIDARRMAVIEDAADWCVTPYTHEDPGTNRTETVHDRRLLQVGHLARLAAQHRMRHNDPAAGRVDKLKDARNRLSHLKPLSIYEIRDLLLLRGSDFNLGAAV